MPKNGAGPRELSEQGYVYTYMSEFDADVWHSTGELVAASEYISSTALSLGKGANADCPLPIEISQFNAGATADYQFDITAAGNYSLELTVSGEGEPKRYDPTLSIVAIKCRWQRRQGTACRQRLRPLRRQHGVLHCKFPDYPSGRQADLAHQGCQSLPPVGHTHLDTAPARFVRVTDVTVENENRLVDVVNAAELQCAAA